VCPQPYSEEDACRYRRGPSPFVVVVTGYPAAGKSTVAKALASALDCVVVARDEAKRFIFDTLGDARNSLPEEALSALTWRWVYEQLDVLLAARMPVVVDGVFNYPEARARFQEWVDKQPFPAAEVHCVVPVEVSIERFGARAASGRVHETQLTTSAQLTEAFVAAGEPLLDSSVVIEIDTSSTLLDISPLADRVIAVLLPCGP
jgi:predicted kinase